MSRKIMPHKYLHSTFSALTGVGLLVMAGSRLAFALMTTAGLLWVYILTALIVFFTHPFYPKIGNKIILISITSLLASAFLLIVWLANPLLAIQVAYLIILIPCYAVASPLFSSINTMKFDSAIIRTVLEAASLGLLITAFALIREPIGFMSLSLPGGAEGIIELFQSRDEDAFLPVRIVAMSSGAFFILAYALALFRNIKKSDA